jgi:hypothetical protein
MRILHVLQDEMYRPKYYQGLMEFRELTLQRLLKFVGQKFFSVRDYLRGEQQQQQKQQQHGVNVAVRALVAC